MKRRLSTLAILVTLAWSAPVGAQIEIVSVAPVEDGLVLSFGGAAEDGAMGFQVFAEPAAGGECSAPSLEAGMAPPGALAVAQRSNTGLDDLEVGLEADTRFAVGVATFDADDNLGPISPLVCATPLGFTVLSNDGGCSVASGADAPATAPWLVLAALLLGLRRRAS